MVCALPAPRFSELPNHTLQLRYYDQVPVTDKCAHTEIKSDADLLPPGAKPGTVPTDAEQSTGLERLEILGKMQGVDIFDMRPLDSSRVGT